MWKFFCFFFQLTSVMKGSCKLIASLLVLPALHVSLNMNKMMFLKIYLKFLPIFSAKFSITGRLLYFLNGWRLLKEIGWSFISGNKICFTQRTALLIPDVIDELSCLQIFLLADQPSWTLRQERMHEDENDVETHWENPKIKPASNQLS